MKWYQLHLSTLLAGVLVWLNAKDATIIKREFSVRALEYFSANGPEEHEVPQRGWPLTFQFKTMKLPGETSHGQTWRTEHLALDLALCLLLLALAGAGIEWTTRRRAVIGVGGC